MSFHPVIRLGQACGWDKQMKINVELDSANDEIKALKERVESLRERIEFLHLHIRHRDGEIALLMREVNRLVELNESLEKSLDGLPKKDDGRQRKLCSCT